MRPSNRITVCRAVAAAATVLALAAAPPIFAQQPGASSLGQPLRLSLGEAARLAARQSNAVQGAEQRAAEALARVTQSRAALLPDLSANLVQSGRTFNSVTFGITLPSAPGQPPLFNPAGEVLGPVNTLDLRGRRESCPRSADRDGACIARSLRPSRRGRATARGQANGVGDSHRTAPQR